MKITISGHGGHCCEAYSDKSMEFGYTIEEAIGNLITKHPEDFGIEIEVLDCGTTAYDRSAYYVSIQEKKSKEDECIS